MIITINGLGFVQATTLPFPLCNASGTAGPNCNMTGVPTVGVVPGIRRLTAFGEQVNLALSLHAANDRLRDELVPLNRRYPLDQLLPACEAYARASTRRLTFEWALIEIVILLTGIGDSLKRLADRP